MPTSSHGGLGSVLREAKKRMGDRTELARAAAKGKHLAVPAEKQREVCLSERYHECDLYREHE